MRQVTQDVLIHHEDTVPYLSFPGIGQTGPFLAAFSTRKGGVSTGIYESMNLNYNQGDDPEDVKENFRRIADSMGVRMEDMVYSAQTHTANVRIMTEEDIPDRFRKSLGGSTKERLDTLINDIIYQSIDSDEIHMSPDIQKEMEDLRRFMYENLYTDSIAKIEEKKVPVLLKILYQYYEQHIDEMPDEYVQLISNGEAEPRVVCDYISGMTDPYAVQKFEELFIPKSWPKQ